MTHCFYCNTVGPSLHALTTDTGDVGSQGEGVLGGGGEGSRGTGDSVGSGVTEGPWGPLSVLVFFLLNVFFLQIFAQKFSEQIGPEGVGSDHGGFPGLRLQAPCTQVYSMGDSCNATHWVTRSLLLGSLVVTRILPM